MHAKWWLIADDEQGEPRVVARFTRRDHAEAEARKVRVERSPTVVEIVWRRIKR